ncbi:MAG: CDP-glycerol glycerophosphotransferase family protein [Spirochaetaceae bacterium]|jgi:hypothetical protein|nr:CDP-glycerol glycerophosphotransferase family protein [Spirochaetaceae bacterium]
MNVGMRAFYAAFFALLAIAPASGYIDPGTGSMLFSFITGITVTLFFFCKNLIIKLRTGGFFGAVAAKKNMRHSLVIYSEGRQYWNVFSPVLEELSRRGVPCAYYSSDEGDPGLCFDSPHVKAECIGKGNAAFRFLNFLEADLCLMTTPGLDVLQLRRSPGVGRYVHILHSTADVGLYKLFSFDYFDAMLLTGPVQIEGIRELERKRGTPEKELIVSGCTYLDVLASRPLPPKGPEKTVLVAPSWGPNSIFARFGLDLLEPLARSSYRVIIRPHPQSLISEAPLVRSLQEVLASYPNVEWNFDAENIMTLSRSDLMISDFSGVIFDFAFLFGRPVFCPEFEFDVRAYEASDLDQGSWTLRANRELSMPLEAPFANIEAVLDRAAARKDIHETINRIRNQVCPYPGEAGSRSAGAICAMLHS